MAAKLGGDSYKNPCPDINMSPSLDAFGAPGRKIRIATKAIDGDEVRVRTDQGELVLRHNEGGVRCIAAKFFGTTGACSS
jgi:hypothetical protein